MEIHQLEYFVAVVEQAGFSRAAAKLGVTQPSLSQQIRKLEGEVGGVLLDRLSRRVVPTQAGERLLLHARRVLAEVADARRCMGKADDLAIGPLWIGAIPTIAPFVLPRVLQRFARDYPLVSFHVVEDVTERLVGMLAQGELDLAVISSYGGHSTIHVEKLASEPLYLAVAAKHRLARKRAVSWAALKKEHLLLLHEMHCLSGQVSRLCRRKGLRLPVAVRGAQLATLAALVSCDMGVSLVPAMMVAQDRSTELVYLPFAHDPPRREINVAWNLLRFRTMPARLFVAALQSDLIPPQCPRDSE